MPLVKAARPLLVPVASSTRWIHCTAATQEATNDAATAVTPHQAACRPARLPKRRMTANESAGSDGTSQAFWSTVPSALQLVDFVEVRTAQVAVDEQHDREAHSHLGGRDRDDEE